MQQEYILFPRELIDRPPDIPKVQNIIKRAIRRGKIKARRDRACRWTRGWGEPGWSFGSGLTHFLFLSFLFGKLFRSLVVLEETGLCFDNSRIEPW